MVTWVVLVKGWWSDSLSTLRHLECIRAIAKWSKEDTWSRAAGRNATLIRPLPTTLQTLLTSVRHAAVPLLYYALSNPCVGGPVFTIYCLETVISEGSSRALSSTACLWYTKYERNDKFHFKYFILQLCSIHLAKMNT